VFIDICNSQPLILCAPINSYGKIDTNYQRDCENGEFIFHWFIPRWRWHYVTKKDVLWHVFLKNMATNKQKFKELFPGVWEFLYENF
jgi:hypothetical protein